MSKLTAFLRAAPRIGSAAYSQMMRGINPSRPLTSLSGYSFGGADNQEKDLSPHMLKARKFFEEFKLEHAAKYPVDKNPLYQYLEESRERGFTAAQMAFFRENFFYRTKGTAISVALAIVSSLQAHDWISAAKISRNMFDEAGGGDPKNIHLLLLEECFNAHLGIVFGLPPLKMKDVEEANITPATKRFRGLQSRTMKEGSYPEIMGRLWAHEREADQMLITFRDTLFENYKEFYKKEIYTEIVQYFAAHIESGVEERHARDAEEAAIKAIASHKVNGRYVFAESSSNFAAGADEFAKSQNDMWKEWRRKLEAEENKGPIIAPGDQFFVPEAQAEQTKVFVPEVAQVFVEEQKQIVDPSGNVLKPQEMVQLDSMEKSRSPKRVGGVKKVAKLDSSKGAEKGLAK